MITRLLIANRGEIACRVQRTARRLGIATVAVYSDADEQALHVRGADAAVHLGPAPAEKSYLNMERILAAARETGADAVHPGYGFLSENAAFAERCRAAGTTFVGPPAAAIAAMGSKSAAKQAMIDAGVPVLPGYHGRDDSASVLLAEATKIGFPVLLKAIAGGGGKGMRIVTNPDDFESQYAAASREALASFGNGTMLVEKYLTAPRHVEVQVFCDSYGNGVYLFERDCSLQRRHQKVIEEAPAPGLSASERQALGESAVQAAKAVAYEGAGTVEFLLDSDRRFYFMEMNTRLQVEHPVTELITGQDLVEWQLRVAAGEALPCSQADLAINGHAVEARLYAEDAENGFLPQSGRLTSLTLPAAGDGVRVDTGVQTGDTVSVHYDPMIAKIIAWGADRETAIDRLCQALADVEVNGLVTNVRLLYALVAHPAFRRVELDTGFIERHHSDLFAGGEDALRWYLAAVAATLLDDRRRAEQAATGDPYSPWLVGDGFRLGVRASQSLVLRLGDDERTLATHVTPLPDGRYRIDAMSAGEQQTAIGALNGEALDLELGGVRERWRARVGLSSVRLFARDGAANVVVLRPTLASFADEEQEPSAVAPMSGTVIRVDVETGQTVPAGTTLVIVEAMKMEHPIKTVQTTTIAAVHCAVGDQVKGGQSLVAFATDDDT
ncbi:MAG: acetyl/propionyl/methylcrotonyl-CoA carboxylase subunit alpha [Pseudomonadota bacterium]